MNEREREIVVISSRKGEKIRTRRGENETVLEIRRNLVLVYFRIHLKRLLIILDILYQTIVSFFVMLNYRSLCDPSDRKKKSLKKKKKNTKERDPDPNIISSRENLLFSIMLVKRYWRDQPCEFPLAIYSVGPVFAQPALPPSRMAASSAPRRAITKHIIYSPNSRNARTWLAGEPAALGTIKPSRGPCLRTTNRIQCGHAFANIRKFFRGAPSNPLENHGVFSILFHLFQPLRVGSVRQRSFFDSERD